MQSWAHRRLSNLQEAHGEVPFPPILLPRKVNLESSGEERTKEEDCDS